MQAARFWVMKKFPSPLTGAQWRWTDNSLIISVKTSTQRFVRRLIPPTANSSATHYLWLRYYSTHASWPGVTFDWKEVVSDCLASPSYRPVSRWNEACLSSSRILLAAMSFCPDDTSNFSPVSSSLPRATISPFWGPPFFAFLTQPLPKGVSWKSK